MADYISRKDAVEWFASYIMMGEEVIPAETVVGDLKWAIPAADVEPVRHGRWVDNEIPDSMLSGCSACGFSCGAYSFRYCPNCGAKMVLEEAR